MIFVVAFVFVCLFRSPENERLWERDGRKLKTKKKNEAKMTKATDDDNMIKKEA